MNTFVGAEYVIANALIALKEKQDYITFEKLREIGVKIQQSFNEHGVDAVILTTGDRIKSAIYNFSDYFEYDEIGDDIPKPIIRIKKSTTCKDLEQRFMGYLPLDVLRLLQKKMLELVA